MILFANISSRCWEN